MKNQNKKGFTLVELVIVIAVIAILAGVLIGTFASVIARANQSKAIQEAKAKVDEAYVEYVAEYKQIPKSASVTLNNGKFASISFGTDKVGTGEAFEGYTLLNSNGHIVLNDVSNQYVYFVWNENGESSTYSVGSTPAGTLLSYDQAQLYKTVKAAFDGAANTTKVTVTITSEEFTSIEFGSDKTNTVEAGKYVQLGKLSGSSVVYYLVFTSTTEFLVVTGTVSGSTLTYSVNGSNATATVVS